MFNAILIYACIILHLVLQILRFQFLQILGFNHLLSLIVCPRLVVQYSSHFIWLQLSSNFLAKYLSFQEISCILEGEPLLNVYVGRKFKILCVKFIISWRSVKKRGASSLIFLVVAPFMYKGCYKLQSFKIFFIIVCNCAIITKIIVNKYSAIGQTYCY